MNAESSAVPNTRARRRQGLRVRDSQSAEEEALRLELAGFTYLEIGQQLACSKSAAINLVKRAIERRRPRLDQQYQEWVDRQQMQIDELYRQMSIRVQSNDPEEAVKAAEVCVKLLKRVADLRGLDKPVKHEIIPPPQQVALDFDPSLLPLEKLEQLREIIALAHQISTQKRDPVVIEGEVVHVLSAPEAIAIDAVIESPQ